MLIPIILIFGCITFLLIGIAAASWAGVEMSEEGPDISNFITLIAGIAVVFFAFFCMAKARDYYHEESIPKTEFTTSIPAQIDTIITIKNSIPDTLYTYHLIEEK